MKRILTIITILSALKLPAQENPWANNNTCKVNPWLTEKKKIDSEEEKKINEIKVKEEDRKNIIVVEDSDSLAETPAPAEKLSAKEKLAELRKNDTDILLLGYKNSKKYYHAEGAAAGAFITTLIPIVGNPIIWILSSTPPDKATLAGVDQPDRKFMNDYEYREGFKKGAKNTRAKKMMTANLAGNLVKLLVFLSIIK